MLNALLKSVQPTARELLAEIRDPEDRAHAEQAVKAFTEEFKAKWPKAVAKITEDREPLLTYFDFTAEHCLHPKTANPIVTWKFATVRLRTRVTKGPGSRAADLGVAFKIIEANQVRWRSVNGPKLLALVRAGAVFERVVLVEAREAPA